jgi:hypothetical protein
MNQISCSLIDRIRVTFICWGKFGVAFIQKLYNLVSELIFRGLQNLHPPVQIWVLPFTETSH